MSKRPPPSKNQSFVSDFPHLLKEWDFKKNQKQPNEIRRGSQKKIFLDLLRKTFVLPAADTASNLL